MRLASFPLIIAKLWMLLLLLACSCSGGDGGGSSQLASGGIGGTGITVGQITGFGSVIVNNVELTSDVADITVNGNQASELDLRIGMVVKIKGQFEYYAQTGVADSIVYEKDLQGPVSKITVVDDQTKELMVLGQTVVINKTLTRFDEPAISFNTVAIDDVIEVSGFIDNDDRFRATWIKLADNPHEFEVEGVIRNLNKGDKTFMINQLTVDYSKADTSALPGGVPQNGQYVSVTSQNIDKSGELIADAVVPEAIQPQASEDDHGEIEGFITDVNPSAEFVVEFELNRWSIGVTGQTIFENGSLTDIQPNKIVEVEGRFNAFGVLVAKRIIFRLGYTEDYATAVAVGPNGNIHVTGYTKDQSSDFDYMTIKYDSNGNRLWVRHYDAGFFNEDMAQAIAVDDQGNVYVTGYSKTNNNDFDFLTVKYDSSGNERWAKTYDFGIGDVDMATAIALEDTDKVYVAGYSKTNNNDFDYTIVRYDSSGNVNFFAGYDGSGMEDKAQGIAVDQTGNVYVTGYSKTNNNDFDFLTVKYDDNGNLQWDVPYDFGIGDVDMATAIALEDTDKVYVAGYSKTNNNDFDYVIVEYDSSGNVNFFASYDGSGMEDKAQGVAVDNAGNVYITGSSKGPITDFDYLTIKFDDNGNLQWDVPYDGAAMDDAAQAITIDDQGDSIVTGYSKGQYSDYDFATIKYNEPAANLVEIEWIDRYDGFFN